MKFEHVPIPVGTQNIDPTVMMILVGVGIVALLVAVSSPRVFAVFALAGGAVAGAFMMS